MIVRWVAGFGRFWYRFIVGDDWMIAASIAVGLVVVYALTLARISAWWLMPVIAPLVLLVSLRRARGQRA
ncbi:MAG TPA: hypothetical protein VGO86_19605 [Candidatus Dormibacteraeota bacterium]